MAFRDMSLAAVLGVLGGFHNSREHSKKYLRLMKGPNDARWDWFSPEQSSWHIFGLGIKRRLGALPAPLLPPHSSHLEALPCCDLGQIPQAGSDGVSTNTASFHQRGQ